MPAALGAVAVCVALACLLRTAKTRAASLASATAAGARAVFPSFRTDPASAATRTLHMSAAWPLPHTRAAVPLAPGTQGGQRAGPTLREEKGSSARSPSAQHRAALSSTSRSHRDEGQSSAAIRSPARRLHRDALPHASLTVTLQHSPGSLTPSLRQSHTVLCGCLEGRLVPHCHFHIVWCCSCELLALSVPLATRCSESVSPVLPGTLSRSFETARRRAVEGITWAALHRLLQLFLIGM